jgi:hypothetical protein
MKAQLSAATRTASMNEGKKKKKNNKKKGGNKNKS